MKLLISSNVFVGEMTIIKKKFVPKIVDISLDNGNKPENDKMSGHGTSV